MELSQRHCSWLFLWSSLIQTLLQLVNRWRSVNGHSAYMTEDRWWWWWWWWFCCFCFWSSASQLSLDGPITSYQSPNHDLLRDRLYGTVFRLLYGDRRWRCTPSGDIWRPICYTTSDVSTIRRNIHHRPALSWHCLWFRRRIQNCRLTYLLTYTEQNNKVDRRNFTANVWLVAIFVKVTEKKCVNERRTTWQRATKAIIWPLLHGNRKTVRARM